jgi:drug/metabolite transporter (DMT)-like permease
MNKRIENWLLLLVLALIWGSSFILMNRAMFDGNNAPALLTASEVGALRMIIAALFVFPFVYKSRKLFFSKDWKWFALVGLLGNFLPAFLFTYAEKTLSSSQTGMLNSLVPIFSLIVSVVLFNNKVKIKGILGVILGFIGTLLLIYFSESSNNTNTVDYAAVLFVISATLCYALSLNIIKEKLGHIESIKITAVSLVYMLVPSIIVLAFTDIHLKVTDAIFYPAFGYTAILAIGGTAIALILFNKLIKQTSAAFASSVTYLIPFVAISWGIVFNEPINWSVSFILLILGGIYLIKNDK